MRLLFGIGLLIAAVVAGVYLNAYHGEVSLQFGEFLLHVPLWLVMISLIIMITLWIVLKSIVVGLWNYPSRWARGQARRRRAKQKEALKKALKGFISGCYAEAEHYFVQSRGEILGGEAQLLAAQAAHQQGLIQQCEYYLQEARKQGVDLIDIDVMRARHALDRGDAAVALKIAETIAHNCPKHVDTLYLRLECYRMLSQWSLLIQLIPELKQYTHMSKEAREAILIEAYQGQLIALSQEKGVPALHELWKAVPRSLKKHPLILIAYADGLSAHQQGHEAEKLLVKQLNQSFDAPLLSCYSRLQGTDANKQFAQVQKWQLEQPEAIAIDHALARLAVRAKHYDKARLYYKKALERSKDYQIELEYAELLARLGDQRQALEYFRAQLSHEH
ncbi:putative protoheme IX biogenesis protein [Piscirickettsia salmonis]|uniref:heme biosynthesis protein HemY n=1 Tax=Piscirickettsia salmonis TaxID=1238 RepID=UPI0012BAD61F|nr:heme biosynthesis HemY N-terminal domain-containing protein [Piscirickettsia salmonis]QGP52753.1 putative protoheme IX biogenesis protein [Piscirickettsia salmonis]QGP57616.1 putative protoheme IX biogenesis protein [Piscirickettsia salmonis]QGP62321.1 putative protoheme IX biogenesis protein [Piscirickettsia salmonis]